MAGARTATPQYVRCATTRLDIAPVSRATTTTLVQGRPVRPPLTACIVGPQQHTFTCSAREPAGQGRSARTPMSGDSRTPKNFVRAANSPYKKLRPPLLAEGHGQAPGIATAAPTASMAPAGGLGSTGPRRLEPIADERLRQLLSLTKDATKLPAWAPHLAATSGRTGLGMGPPPPLMPAPPVPLSTAVSTKPVRAASAAARPAIGGSFALPSAVNKMPCLPALEMTVTSQRSNPSSAKRAGMAPAARSYLPQGRAWSAASASTRDHSNAGSHGSPDRSTGAASASSASRRQRHVEMRAHDDEQDCGSREPPTAYASAVELEKPKRRVCFTSEDEVHVLSPARAKPLQVYAAC